MMGELAATRESTDIDNSVLQRTVYLNQIIDFDVLERLRDSLPSIRERVDITKAKVRDLFDSTANEHGLIGKELDLKINALSWASCELYKISNSLKTKVGPRKTRRLISLIGKNFEILEILIGSILEATGSKTALKEVVGLLGKCLKDFNKR